VSFNGYAWYSDSAIAPVNPGLEKKNFLAQMCRCGHDAGMKVMGYFTFGNNPVWEAKNPALRKDEGVDYIRIPATLEWLDYFCRQVEDALKKTAIDGFLVDWLRPVQHKMWIEAEKRMWQELMVERFPSTGSPSPAIFTGVRQKGDGPGLAAYSLSRRCNTQSHDLDEPAIRWKRSRLWEGTNAEGGGLGA
jgi:hypothetical protein